MNFFNHFTVFCDAPQPWGVYFQDSVSPQVEALVELHDNIMFYLVIILFGVSWIMVSIIRNYVYKKYFISNNLNHGTLIEFIWTITPALILMSIAFPSFKLLYLMDEVTDSSLTMFFNIDQWEFIYLWHDYNDDDEYLKFDKKKIEFEFELVDSPDLNGSSNMVYKLWDLFSHDSVYMHTRIQPQLNPTSYSMDDNQNSPSGYDSDRVSEYSIASNSNNNLAEKLAKYEERLETSKNTSDRLAEDLEFVNGTLKNIITSRFNNIQMHHFNMWDRGFDNRMQDTGVDPSVEAGLQGELVRNNIAFDRTSHYVNRVRDMQNRGLVSTTSPVVVETLREAGFLMDSFKTNSSNLMKDVHNIRLMKVKLNQG